jgi:hypothetical protein
MEVYMKKPDLGTITSSVENGLAYAKEHGEPVAKQVYEKGRSALQSKTGKRIAQGVVAGGAIGFAVPVLSMTTGAILGAGLMVLYQSLKAREPD